MNLRCDLPAQAAVRYRDVDSPVGLLTVAADDAGIRLVEFENPAFRTVRGPQWRQGDHPLIDLAATQLAEYFSGQRRSFDLPLSPAGTAFQLSVWRSLQQIPYGTTWSYGQLAAHVGNPRAVRAAGGANRCNPIAIVIPCHRVIGSNGTLTGFAGGLQTKEFLLKLERG